MFNILSVIQDNVSYSYVDGTPVSYQLWNNYLFKNKNYNLNFIRNHFEETSADEKTEKGREMIIKSLVEKAKFTQMIMQPQILNRNSCTLMVTHVLAEPDWINIPCDQKTPGIIICQKLMSKPQLDIRHYGHFINTNEYKTCHHKAISFENMCILFKKHEKHMNISELHGQNIIESVEINVQDKKIMAILLGYFNIIQHFYIQPIQFTISLPLRNRYIVYKPLQTPYYHKLNWIHSRDTVTKYDGYILSVSKSITLQIPSNTFQCEDDSFIDEMSICDGIIDCTDATDEKLCYCNNTLDIFNTKCKYICEKTSQQCSCSHLYFTCLSSFKCIPYIQVCDNKIDCLHGEDEICEKLSMKKSEHFMNILSTDNFTCIKSNTTIPAYLVDDLIPDCPGSIEDEMQYYYLMTNILFMLTVYAMVVMNYNAFLDTVIALNWIIYVYLSLSIIGQH